METENKTNAEEGATLTLPTPSWGLSASLKLILHVKVLRCPQIVPREARPHSNAFLGEALDPNRTIACLLPTLTVVCFLVRGLGRELKSFLFVSLALPLLIPPLGLHYLDSTVFPFKWVLQFRVLRNIFKFSLV